MNAERRKKIAALKDQIETVRAELETLREEEQDYFDAMPEAFQNGEKGEKAQAAIDAMEEAISQIESVSDQLDEAAA